MKIKKNKKKILLTLAILGFLTSVKLFLLYLNVNYNPQASPSFCSINELIDCDSVEKSTLSQTFGIPFACWGMFLYSLIILFIFVDKLKNFKLLKFLQVFKNPQAYIAALGYIAFTLSLILALTAYIQMKKICIVCALTYLFDISIAITATNFKKGGIDDVFKTSFVDFLAGIKIPKYGISFAICALAFIGFLYYTTSSYVFVPHLIMPRDIKHYEKLIQNNPYKINNNVLGDKNAKITIELFTDYECPICRINNVMVNRAVKEVNGIKVEHKNLPLDKKCNHNLNNDFHINACMYAKYAIAAENQGKWGIMNDLLFKNQPATEIDLIDMIENEPFDIMKLLSDVNSEETLTKLKSDIEQANKYGIEGTPSFVINGKVYSGIKSYKNLKNMFENARDGKEINK